MASLLFSGVPVYEIRKTRRDNDLLIRDTELGRDLAKSLGIFFLPDVFDGENEFLSRDRARDILTFLALLLVEQKNLCSFVNQEPDRQAKRCD
jgi:hypothetical protein